MQLIQYWLVGKPAYTLYIYLDELLQGGINKVIWVRFGRRTAGKLSWLYHKA